MINYIKVSLGIFAILAISRFVPHPPNFTSLLALTFYVPAILGIKFLPALILSFVITDMFVGFHNTIFFTWGSVVFIALLAKYFFKNTLSRMFGAIIGVFLFFIITNFGVWTSSGLYDYNLNGLILCYYLALPFLMYNFIAPLIFSTIIESIYAYRNNTIKGYLKKLGI